MSHIWIAAQSGAEGLGQHDVIRLFLALAVLVGLARAMGELARKIHLPAVLGELIAGIVLGATVLGRVAPGAHAYLFPESGNAFVALEFIITLGVALLLLVAGMEVNLSIIWRQGYAALLVATGGMLLPFAAGSLLGWRIPETMGILPGEPLLPFALFIGIVLGITALPVISKILLDLNVFKSDMGMLIMSAALVTDLVGWMGFALVLALIEVPGSNGAGGAPILAAGAQVMQTLVLTVGFVAFMLTIGRWVINRLLPYIQGRWSWPGGVIGFILVLTFLCGAATEWIGVHVIFGAFILGVVVGDSRHLRERTRDTLEQFIYYIFAPVFFASIALHVDFVDQFDLTVVLILLLVGAATKIGGAYVGARLARLSHREGFAVGFGLATHGAMEIILAQIAAGPQFRLISDRTYVAVILMSLVTSLTCGPALQWLLKLKQQRRLGDVLSEKQFVANMQSDNARGAIEELSARAAQISGLSAERIAEAVWQREQLMHTGIGNYMAVPHARLEEIKKPLAIIGRSMRGIDFDSADGTPAKFIGLLLTPKQDAGAQIELLSLVTRAFGSEQSRAHAMAAENYTELLAALSISEQPSRGE